MKKIVRCKTTRRREATQRMSRMSDDYVARYNQAPDAEAQLRIYADVCARVGMADRFLEAALDPHRVGGSPILHLLVSAEDAYKAVLPFFKLWRDPSEYGRLCNNLRMALTLHAEQLFHERCDAR